MKTKPNRFLVSSIVAVVALSPSAFAADVLKDDNTDNLNLGTSWDGGSAPGTGDVAVWDSTVTGPNTVNLGANLSWGGLRIEDPGGDVTIGGANSLTLGSSGLNLGDDANLTFNNTGNITLNGPLSGSTVLTLNSNATKNWSNAGSGMTSVDFTGTLVLRGGTGAAGSFSNNWLAFGANGVGTISQTGAFHLDTGESLTNRGDFIFTGGWGDGSASNPKLSLASLTGWGDLRSDWGNTTDPGNRTISVNSSGTHEFQGRIVQNNNTHRSIHFEKLGSGTQILSGENSYQNTIVGGGKLQIGNGGATGNIGLGTVSVASGATLEFNRTGLLDYKASARMRNVSGAGDIVLNGGVKLFNYTGSGLGFNEANSWNNFSGNLIIKGGSEFQTIRNGATAMGTAQITLGDATTSGKLSQIEGNWTWTNNIQLVGSANEILNNAAGADRWNKIQGVISGDGNVTFANPGGGMNNGNLGFILTGTNTMSGTVTVDTFVRVGGVTGENTSQAAGTGGTLGTADVVINSGGRLTFSRSDAHAVANEISGAGRVHIGATGITGTNTQDLTLSGNNTYSGGTEVLQGTLRVSAFSGIGTGYLAVKNGSTFRYTGTGSESTTRTLWMDEGAATIHVENATAQLTWNPGGGTRNQAFTKDGDGELVLGGAISGASGSVTVAGGALTLTGTNTYTGNTTVAAGVLALGASGSISQSAVISVASGAEFDVSSVTGGWTLGADQTLAGSGTVSGNVNAAGAISPGNSIGTLSIVGNLSFADTSTFAADIHTGNGLADRLVLSGNLSIASGSALELTDLAATSSVLAIGTRLALIDYSNGLWDGGLFTYNDSLLANHSMFSAFSNDWMIRYDDDSDGSNDGNFVTLTVIPEPRAAALFFLGALALLRRRR